MVALPYETREAASDRGFEGWSVGAFVRNHPAKPCVQLTCAGDAGHFRDIAREETAGGQDRDAISSLLDQSPENGRALPCISRST